MVDFEWLSQMVSEFKWSRFQPIHFQRCVIAYCLFPPGVVTIYSIALIQVVHQ
jgi:hypothetical protein